MNKKQESYKYNIGLVMSGGGARGFAHAGVLEAFNEEGISPEVISGVSAGAIVGALYADGHSPQKIKDLFLQKGLFKYFRVTYPRQGLLKMTGLARVLKKYLNAQNFEDLSIPLHVCTTNLTTGKREDFNSGPLQKIIFASASIPILFSPTNINNHYHVDGGLIDNFPIQPIEKLAKILIGIHVNPIGEDVELNNIINIAERAFHLSIGSSIIEKKKKCDIFIEPKGLNNYRVLSINKGAEIYQIGYDAGKEIIKNPRTRKILESID